MLDTHIIHCSEPSDWLARAIESAMPYDVRVIDGAGKTTAQNRAQAIAESSAEFVSWVDPDDWIAPEHIPAMLDALSDNPQAVGAFSAETVIDAEGRTITAPDLLPGPWRALSQLTSPRYAHNLTVLRRAHALPYLDAMQAFNTLSEYALKGLMTERGPWVRVPAPAYYWRMHPAQLHRQTTREEHARAIRLVQPHLIAHTSGAARIAARVVAAAHPAKCGACNGVRKLIRR